MNALTSVKQSTAIYCALDLLAYYLPINVPMPRVRRDRLDKDQVQESCLHGYASVFRTSAAAKLQHRQ